MELITNPSFFKIQKFRWMGSIRAFKQNKLGRRTTRTGTAYARSLLGQSSRYMIMATPPFLIELFKVWSMIVALIQIYDILISQSDLSSTKCICIDLLISVHRLKKCQVWGFEKNNVNPSNFTQWNLWRCWCSNLILKKISPPLHPRCVMS